MSARAPRKITPSAPQPVPLPPLAGDRLPPAVARLLQPTDPTIAMLHDALLKQYSTAECKVCFSLSVNNQC